jgi:lipopolysaccharide transport system permease protein
METVVIEPNKGEAHYWQEVWRFRELFQVLAQRDVSVRYKQTAIGIAWTFIQPLAAMLVFTIIFGRVAKMPSAGVPYPLLVFAGILPWQFFSSALGSSSQSMVNNAGLVSKVYFPRVIVPASTIFTALFDFFVSLGLMGFVMAIFRYPPGWQIVTLPIFVLWAFFCVLGP